MWEGYKKSNKIRLLYISFAFVTVFSTFFFFMPDLFAESQPESVLYSNSKHSLVALSNKVNPEHLSAGSTGSTPLTLCTEPRPGMCTQDYRPVCAEKSDGSSKTYSNGCTACSDPDVIGYVEGACAEQ